jgi:hypothetical protein
MLHIIWWMNMMSMYLHILIQVYWEKDVIWNSPSPVKVYILKQLKLLIHNIGEVIDK